MTEAPEETIHLPASEKFAINRMADKFKDAMKGLQATEPSKSAQASDPEIPELPKTHKDWKYLRGLKDKFQNEAEAAKAELEKLKAHPAPAAAAVAEPSTLAQVDGEPELPVETQGKARQAFQTLKGLKEKAIQDAQSAAKERDRYKAELEAAKNNPSPEMIALRKELDARDLIVKQLAISQDPRFQNHFAEKFQNALVEAREAAGEESGEQLEQIFALPASPHRDLQVEQLAENLDLSDMRRLDLLDSYKSHKRAEKERAAELAKAPANLEIIRAQAARAQQDAELKQVRERAQLYQYIEGSLANDLTGADPQTAKAILSDTKNFIDGKASTEQYTQTLADAARWRRHEPTRKAQAELIETLQGQLSEMQAASPSLQSNGGAERKPKPPPLDNSDMGDKFNKAMGKPSRRAVLA